MLVSSILSLTASLVLSIEAVQLAADKNAIFSCDISAYISCGKVAKAWQSSLLGFPNAFLGLICEPVVITVAIAGITGVIFNRKMMQIATLIYFIGFLFAYWLFIQSYFYIHALCPWCLLVTATTTTVFSSMLRVNLIQGNIPLPERWKSKVNRGLELGVDHMISGIAIATIVAMIVLRYL